MSFTSLRESNPKLSPASHHSSGPVSSGPPISPDTVGRMKAAAEPLVAPNKSIRYAESMKPPPRLLSSYDVRTSVRDGKAHAFQMKQDDFNSALRQVVFDDNRAHFETLWRGKPFNKVTKTILVQG